MLSPSKLSSSQSTVQPMVIQGAKKNNDPKNPFVFIPRIQSVENTSSKGPLSNHSPAKDGRTPSDNTEARYSVDSSARRTSPDGEHVKTSRTLEDHKPGNCDNIMDEANAGAFNSEHIEQASGANEHVTTNQTERNSEKLSRLSRFSRFLSHIVVVHPEESFSDNIQTKHPSSYEEKSKKSPPMSTSPNSRWGASGSKYPTYWRQPERVLSTGSGSPPVKLSPRGFINRLLSHVSRNHSEEMPWLQPAIKYRPTPEQVSHEVLVPILGKTTITIGNNKYNGPQSILNSEWYKELSSEFNHVSLCELISFYGDKEKFLTKQHLRDAVNHDIDVPLKELISEQSVQNQFLTRNGWINKLKQYDSENKTKFFAGTQLKTFWSSYKFAPVNKSCKKDVDFELRKLTSTEQVKLYRTMPLKEAADIIENRNLNALNGHLGDFTEALSYLHRGGGGKVTLEFPLKPGAHELLFSPSFSAIQGAGKLTSIIAKFAEINKQGSFPKGSRNEGSAAGYIGIKSEATGDSGLSISISDKQSCKLFEALVNVPDIKIIARRD